jgi:hypothetical protein
MVARRCLIAKGDSKTPISRESSVKRLAVDPSPEAPVCDRRREVLARNRCNSETPRWQLLPLLVLEVEGGDLASGEDIGVSGSSFMVGWTTTFVAVVSIV